MNVSDNLVNELSNLILINESCKKALFRPWLINELFCKTRNIDLRALD